MRHRIARLFEPLLRFLLPGTGRHRGTATASAHQQPGPSPAPGQIVCRVGSYPLHGEDNAMVRPYLVAHEEHEEARRQRARRRALWLAVHGIDIGPRIIHGVEVTA